MFDSSSIDLSSPALFDSGPHTLHGRMLVALDEVKTRRLSFWGRWYRCLTGFQFVPTEDLPKACRGDNNTRRPRKRPSFLLAFATFAHYQELDIRLPLHSWQRGKHHGLYPLIFPLELTLFFTLFPQQVALVWMRPRTIATYLFVLNRYLPFIDISMSLYGTWSTSPPVNPYTHPGFSSSKVHAFRRS